MLAITTGLAFSQTQTAPKPTGSRPTTANADCTSRECHAALAAKKFLHGPVALNRCQECHKYQDAALHRFQSLAAPNQG